MPLITTNAQYVAPDQFAHGSVSIFSVAADLRVEADLEVFVQAAAQRATIIQLGTPSDTAMRFVVENNGITAAQLSADTGETVTVFAL